MKVLCVAEKPSISKAVSRILSNDSAQTRPTDNKYIKNYCFRSRFQGQDCEVVMTALLGHLMEMDFPDHYRGWRSCAFQDLFDAPIRKAVRADMDALARNLRSEARHADVLFIWTDCDREGENIGWEVAEVCRTARPAIQVRRARFSVVQAPEVLRAWAQPVDLDLRQAMAVEARQELDLRVGAAFTRFQTLHLGAAFAEFQEAPQHAHGRAKSKLLSYGSCQFPTLGFVVYRYLEASRFVSETFWKIEMRLKSPAIGETASDTSDQTVSFAWQKGHVFDDAVAQALYARCFDARGQASARIIRVNSRPTTRRPPLPLTTVEMQRACSTKLRLASDRVMTLAEALYNQGFISYPRTETDEFEPTFPLRDLIGQQTSDPAFGPYAHFLLEDGGFQFPRRGQHNDKAHPPIHPVKSGHALQGDERRIFEFVTRRFLACCSKAAMGQETTVEAHVRDEVFTASGTMILDPAWYRVYPYERWTGRLLPTFRPGDVIVPDVFTIATGKTTAPRLLTEADLISLMDKSGIGTDATIHEHIKKLFERQYAAKEGAAITPTTLGIALIAGYDAMAIGVNLARPNLRAAMERTMVDICSGAKQREQVVRDAVRSYRDVFLQVLNQRRYGRQRRSRLLAVRQTSQPVRVL
ncbi:hypothetical protein CXG81DRAFT_30289 [Caulochytrium protostelioides]|uniref:DNA topoisomerase n=1 Tax=Caulochytrium protostelioides TaxID=1555241 RepID=A0A4P9X2V6_9FUNG|nr:hypothetical protein CXG81DRAFT_30289 [Caulochytrium protostelioides]|eukprot:RKO99126.1 hypothetical protein CXG81DRAFT_30289 [Caulochytrium protostelioides]